MKGEIIKEETSSVDSILASGPKNLTRKQKFIKEFKSISVILFAVLLFRSIFFEPFRIPSGSMIPTLMIGDFILVNKMAYGVKVPFSDWFWDPIYIGQKKNPKRGDVIVFKYPKDPSINYIKRVVAVPGDMVEIRNKNVYVNDKLIQTKDITNSAKGVEIATDMDDKFISRKFAYYNTTTGKRKHYTQLDTENYANTDLDRRKVPQGKFFVMGDNRDFSYDSRYWGYVPHEHIKGEAIFVWLSIIFPKFISGNNAKFRPHRIGNKIN